MKKAPSERAVSAAYPLIGLGPGATPSGDDLLVGLAAGLAVTDHPLAGAFAAFLSTSSGLIVSLAGVLSQDVLRLGGVRGFRISTMLAGIVPLAMTWALRDAGDCANAPAGSTSSAAVTQTASRKPIPR